MNDEVRKKRAESYSAHMLIALEVNDHGAPFRDFFDNWYAYEVGGGHLSRSGMPVWFNRPCAVKHQFALSAMHFITRAAKAVLDQAEQDGAVYARLRQNKDNGIRLMVDHAVPVGILRRMLFKEESLRSAASISEFLRKYYRVGVLTFKEDAELNRLGLRSRMPDNWDGKNVFSRYEVACLEQA